MPTKLEDGDGWKEWSKFVIKEIERLSAKQEENQKKFDKYESMSVQMKFIWSLLTAVIIAVLVKYITN